MAIVQHNVGALPRELKRDLAPNADVGAGDESSSAR
jgi:hypothetical protein